jgi:hypothetical protein
MKQDVDVNLLSICGDRQGEFIKIERHIDGTGFDDALKLSGARGNYVDASLGITGGSEDCLDVNHSRFCTIETGLMKPMGRFGVTIKGGSEGITVRGNMFPKCAKEVDIDLGNWSDQDESLTTDTVLAVQSIDGRPLTYRVLHATRPHLPQGSGPWRNAFPWLWLGPIHRLIVWGLRIGQKRKWW